MKWMKAVALMCALCVLTLCFAGCGVDVRKLAVINGEELICGEFTFFLESMKTMMAQDTSLNITDEESWNTVEIENQVAIEVAKQRAFEDAVSLYVQVAKAKEQGVSIASNEDRLAINTEKQNYIANMGGQSEYDKMLKEYGLTDDIFTGIIEKYKYASNLQTKILAEDEAVNAVTDDEIQAKYDAEVELMLTDALTVKHILIMSADPTTGEDRGEAARETAQGILDRIKAGEDFETLMKEYSEDGEGSYEGYTFNHNDGQFIQEFDDASFALAEGEVSELVQTAYGYHIIKRYPLAMEIPALEDVRDAVISIIKSDRYTALVDEWIETATIDRDEEIYSSIK